MKVIRFPKAANKSILEIKTHNKEISSDRIHLGAFQYTCYNCKEVIYFHPENMIFKKIEFYCSSCGTHHKVSNPAFGPGSKK